MMNVFCRIYVDIMAWEEMLSIELANMELIGQFVHPIEGEEGKGDGRVEIVILARCKFHFIREHEKLV